MKQNLQLKEATLMESHHFMNGVQCIETIFVKENVFLLLMQTLLYPIATLIYYFLFLTNIFQIKLRNIFLDPTKLNSYIKLLQKF